MEFWNRFNSVLKLGEPIGPCPVGSVRPTFRWVYRGVSQAELTRQLRAADAQLRLRVWQLGQRADIGVVVGRRPTREWSLNASATSFSIPKHEKPLRTATGYAWQLAAVTGQGMVLASSEPGVFYVDDPELPLSMAQLLCCGDEKSTFGWVRAYGNPAIQENAKGFLDRPGIAELAGNWRSGDAITRRLAASERIVAGRVYTISIAVRARPREREDVRFRLLAHSQSLPTSGIHPASSPTRIVVGETGTVTSDDWTWVVLPPWRAPRSFSRLSVLAFADPRADDPDPLRTPAGRGQVSAICIREVDGCEAEARLVGAGPEIRLGRSVELVATDTLPRAEFVSTDLGAMSDLFGDPFDEDGRSRWYTPGDKCVSMGGWVPEDLESYVPWLKPNELIPPNKLIEQLVSGVLADLADPDVSALQPIDLNLSDSCRPRLAPHLPDRDVITDPPPPFDGRDIVFVQGFLPMHLIARYIKVDANAKAVYDNISAGVNGSVGPVNVNISLEFEDSFREMLDNIEYEWPTDPEAYLVKPADPGAGTAEEPGYFRRTDYWDEHIKKYFGKHEHPNRFIITGYNSSQRLIFSVHALLAQIAEAMSTGTGVRTANKDKATETDCFGVEYAIVSHSTGALVTCVAMAIAERSATDPEIQAVFGDVSAIAQRARVHLSLHGAVGGSDLASLGLSAAAEIRQALAGGADAADKLARAYAITRMMLIAFVWQPDSPTANFISAMLNGVAAVSAGLHTSASNLENMLMRSVVVDLAPQVARTLWRDEVSASPVPTLTVAGGHPTAILPAKPILHGFDDGVVNTNSQSGSNSPMPPVDPNSPLVDTYTPLSLVQVYDMGLPIERAAPLFVEQTFDYKPNVAYGSTPRLSPSGMVQPLLSVANIPRHRNQFIFIQTTAEHGYPTPKPDDTIAAKSELYEPTIGRTNYEESLVVERPHVFTSGLVHPSMITYVRRFERRLDLTLRLRFRIPQITLLPPRFTMRTVTITVTQLVWRRFYDLLTTYRPAPDEPPLNTTHEVALSWSPDDISAVSTIPLPTVSTSDGFLNSDPLVARQHLLDTNGEYVEFGECSWAYRFVLSRL